MSRLQLWILIGVLVALAAFVTGVVRGVSGTSPFVVERSPRTEAPSPEET